MRVSRRQFRPLTGVCVAALCALAGSSASAASAAELRVTRNDDPPVSTCTPANCSLRVALAAAGDGDTVVLGAGDVHLDPALGQLVIRRDLRLRGAGAATRVVGAAPHRVLLVEEATVVLEDLELTGGRLDSDPAAEDPLAETGRGGGGLLNAGGDVTLRHVVVRDNRYRSPIGSDGGGGIGSTGRLLVEDSEIVGNRGDDFGGGATGGGVRGVPGRTEIRRSRIAGNATIGNVSADGGGVYGGRVVDSVVEGNLANASFGEGGGVASATVVRSVLRGNQASAQGGGAFGSDLDSSLVTDNAIDPDQPADGTGGGGVALMGRIANSTITLNRGGEVLAGSRSGTVIVASTIAAGAGSALQVSYPGLPVTVTASIVAGRCRLPTLGTALDGGGSIVTDSSCPLGRRVGDLRLGELQTDGGSVPTRAPRPGSPAIDAAGPGPCAVDVDARGTPRPLDGDGDGTAACDAGAVEVVDEGGCTIQGTDGPDVLRGTSRRDVICGGAGDDRLIGLGGPDTLRGEAGDDVLQGGTGADELSGGSGDDRLDGGPDPGEPDTLACGLGVDVAVRGQGDVARASCERTIRLNWPAGSRWR